MPITEHLKLWAVSVESKSNSVLFGVHCWSNSQLIVLPAIPRELVYIQLCFLSGLSLAAWGQGTQVSGVRGCHDVKTFDWVRFTLRL